jgi:hypothetical protein
MLIMLLRLNDVMLCYTRALHLFARKKSPRDGLDHWHALRVARYHTASQAFFNTASVLVATLAWGALAALHSPGFLESGSHGRSHS